MTSNTIQFTAIPNGIISAGASGTVVSVAVYVTPQLVGSGNLGAVSAFANWAQTASTLAFNVQFAGTGVTVPASLDDAHAANRFDKQLWTAMFPSAMPVNAWTVPNHASAGVLSYGAKTVSGVVKSAYGAAAQLTARPVINASPAAGDVLSTHTANIARVLPAGQQVGNTVASGAGTTQSLSKTALTPAIQSLTVQPTETKASPEFARAAAFHNRNNYRNLQPQAAPGATSTVPLLDFHAVVGQLADHPEILRRLGLIIDLKFTLPGGLGTNQSIAVIPTTAIAGFAPAQIYSPWTKCVVKAYSAVPAVTATFRPYYADAEAGVAGVTPLVDTNGLLRVDDDSILHVDDLDIDHAATHVSHYAEQAQNDLNAAQNFGQSSLQVSLPALRTTGFALHHQDREQHLALRFTKTAQWNPAAVTFVAEDLVRGYRADVRSVTLDPSTNAITSKGAWTSLCARKAHFVTTAGNVDSSDKDEGYVKAASMSAAANTPVYNVNESLFHWDGWSLVVGRPGLSVGADSSTNGVAQPDKPVQPVSDGSKAGVAFSTMITPKPGTLPKLRFGTTYQFRVRAVSLAGDDMANAAADNASEHASVPKTFVRYEPVSPPVLQLRNPVTEGESVEHLVIRSDPYRRKQTGGTDAAPIYTNTPVYATQWAATAPAGMNKWNATSERHVAPPKTSVHMAEYHGAIDAAIASIPPSPIGTPVANDMRTRAAWAIASKEEGTFFDLKITDSSTGQYRTATNNRVIVTPSSAKREAVYFGSDDIPRGNALATGQYAIFPDASVILPYLPDPNAKGIAIHDLQGVGTTTFRSYGARVRNASNQIWPELSTFRLVINDANENTGNPLTGVDDNNPNPGDALTVALAPGAVMNLQYSSTINDPTAHAFGPTVSDMNAKNTFYQNGQNGKLPLVSPTRALTLVHAVQRPRPPLQAPGDVTLGARAEGETAVTVNPIMRFDGATSGRVDLIASWNEYVDIDVPVAGSNPPVVQDPSANPVLHTGTIVALTPDVGQQSYTSPPVRQMFGDTKRRDITYRTKATTRFREYFPPSITSDTDNITNTAVLPALICPSTARPPVPKVLYAVPSFVLKPVQVSGSTATKTRAGGTVRVYVDRGWFASGADERLAVICASSQAQSDANPHLVSLWGTDPIWSRQSIASYLDYTHMTSPANAEYVFNVPLTEKPSEKVHIATYKPNFNKERRLWYFDIGISPEQAYFPFLRLALARYQPQSVGTLHLSRIVTAEFVQLSAERTATVVDLGNGQYNVSLSGPTAANMPQPGANAAALASGHVVTAEFQQATTATPDAIDWTTIGSVTTFTATSNNGNNVMFQPLLNGAVQPMTFPAGAAAPGSQHRILFREYEVYATDPGVQQATGLVQIGQASNVPYTTRLVYMDAVPVR